ncbi:hypothetical protein [Salinicola halophilus]|uniref:hypothetical protein n=1 Tax=Salinicola halophilus TaxID=184065 RepID=UPI000DA21CA9|nr:hypothetical protein [Salinicola halophilus]
MGTPLSPRCAQVIDLETRRDRLRARKRLVRLSPELDGLEMLYYLSRDPDTLYGLPVLAWGLREDGNVAGLVPWMDRLTPCHELEDPEYGHFMGYRDPETQDIFYDAPAHKIAELEHAAAYFDYEETGGISLTQQLPETQGTHALCATPGDEPWQLKQVYGWHLYSDGGVDAMLLDDDEATSFPILAGDDCLYPGRNRHSSLYFFQRSIANRIREHDGETLEALALMVSGKEE